MEPLADLSDGKTFRAGFPHASLTWLRENAPVYWHPPTEATPDGEGFWVVSRYDDVNKVFRNPKTFSSDKGGDRRAGGTGINDDRSAGLILNFMDDPKHRRVRSLVTQGFTPRTIGRLEAELRAITGRILDDIGDGESIDFVLRVARELPLQAICIILGVPAEDRTRLVDWVDMGIANPDKAIIAPEYMRKVAKYADGLIEEKRRAPTDDILSVITHATLDEEPEGRLTNQELRLFFNLLFPAGVETTRNSIGSALLTFIKQPDQLARLRADPSLMKTAVEEILRWTTPSVYKRRTATKNTKLGDVRIRAGDKVTIWEMSANRDERVFGNPFEFDITRDPNPHIAFGVGVHVCLGAALARLELAIMFEELLKRFETFELAGDYGWVENNRLLGLTQLPVRMH